MADALPYIAAFLYGLGFICATVTIHCSSDSSAGFMGLIAAVIWPLWLPVVPAVWQAREWDKRVKARQWESRVKARVAALSSQDQSKSEGGGK